MAKNNQVFLEGYFDELKHFSNEVGIATLQVTGDGKNIPVEIVCMGKPLKVIEKVGKGEKIWVEGKITQYKQQLANYNDNTEFEVIHTQLRAQSISRDKRFITTVYKELISETFGTSAPLNCCDKCGWEMASKKP